MACTYDPCLSSVAENTNRIATLQELQLDELRKIRTIQTERLQIESAILTMLRTFLVVLTIVVIQQLPILSLYRVFRALMLKIAYLTGFVRKIEHPNENIADERFTLVANRTYGTQPDSTYAGELTIAISEIYEEIESDGQNPEATD